MAQQLRAVDKSRRTLIFPTEPAMDDYAAQTEPQTLAERFNWLREVGRTARSTVYHGEMRGQGLFAVEVLADDAAADPAQVELFYLEAEAAARLQHPHIVRAFTAEPIANTHLRRAAFTRGAETLRQLLARRGWFDPGDALRLIAQIAHALDYAHQAGVHHLNLQPELILFDSDGRVRVGGFGLAADEPRPWMRQLRTSKCAPPYLSPEQLNGAPGDAASDLYALGAVCYEMLTDRVPFDSDDVEHLRRRHRTQQPQPPHNLRPGLPLEPSRAVMELLERDSVRRVRLFNGAGGLKAALRLTYDVEVAPPKTTAARATNPMPLFEIAAELAESKLEAQVTPPRITPPEELSVAMEPPPVQAEHQADIVPPLIETEQQADSTPPASTGPVFVPPPILITPEQHADIAPPSGQENYRVTVALPPEDEETAAKVLPRNEESPRYQAALAAPVARARPYLNIAHARPYLKYIHLTLIALTVLSLIWLALTFSRRAALNNQPAPSPSPAAVAVEPTPIASPPSASAPEELTVNVTPDNAVGYGATTRAAAPKPASAKPRVNEQPRAFIYGAAVKRVKPGYPSAARARQVSGSVIVKVSVDEKGKVTKAEAIAGPPILRAAAENAARGWKFKPSTVNGRPVRVTNRIAFNFNLPKQ